MISLVLAILRSFFAGCHARRKLVLKNLALRHQLLCCTARFDPCPPQFRPTLLGSPPRGVVSVDEGVSDRPAADGCLLASGRLPAFLALETRSRTGRPPKDRELIDLIRRIWQANPTWGSPWIRAELAKLGLDVSAATVRSIARRASAGHLRRLGGRSSATTQTNSSPSTSSPCRRSRFACCLSSSCSPRLHRRHEAKGAALN